MLSKLIPDTMRILVVDDDPATLILIRRMIERIGPTPITVSTGTGALSVLELGPVDLFILDLLLPDIDGFEILAMVRNDPRLDEMPVLILSAYIDDGSIKRGLELGADSYITKPYMSNTLADQVRTLIQRGRTAA